MCAGQLSSRVDRIAKRIARRPIRRVAPNREALYKNPNREARGISENTSVKVGTLEFCSVVDMCSNPAIILYLEKNFTRDGRKRGRRGS